MPSGLHLNYEEDFLNYQSHQVPAVFTDPLFLPNMVNSVYKLVMPPVLSGAPPFAAAQDHPPFPQNQGMIGIVWCHPVLHQVLSVHPQQRIARRGHPQPPSKSLANLIQSQIKLRTWNPRQAHLTQLKCSCPSQIVPSGNELMAKQTV